MQFGEPVSDASSVFDAFVITGIAMRKRIAASASLSPPGRFYKKLDCRPSPGTSVRRGNPDVSPLARGCRIRHHPTIKSPFLSLSVSGQGEGRFR